MLTFRAISPPDRQSWAQELTLPQLAVGLRAGVRGLATPASIEVGAMLPDNDWPGHSARLVAPVISEELVTVENL